MKAMFLCFKTPTPLSLILTIFSFRITVHHFHLRGVIWQETHSTDELRAKKSHVWPVQSQNNTGKERADLGRVISCKLMNNSPEDDYRGNRF